MNNFSLNAINYMRKIDELRAGEVLPFLLENTQKVPVKSNEYKIFRAENVLFYLTNGNKVYYLRKNIEQYEDWELVPKFVKRFQIYEDEYLIIMEYDTEKLIPYQKVADKVSVYPKKLFKDRLLNMVNIFQVNIDILENPDALLIYKEGKDIVHPEWFRINFILPEDRQKYIDMINNLQI